MGTRIRGSVLMAGLLVLTATGCTKYGSVKGKITYGKDTLGGGTVQFIPKKGASVSSAIGTDGSYSIDKVSVGPVKIVVDTSSVQPPPPGRGGGGAAGGLPTTGFDRPQEAADDPMYSGKRTGGKYVPIPPKYANPDQTDAEYDVQPGAQEHNIELK